MVHDSKSTQLTRVIWTGCTKCRESAFIPTCHELRFANGQANAAARASPCRAGNTQEESATRAQTKARANVNWSIL